MSVEVDILWTGDNTRGEMVYHSIDHFTDVSGKKLCVICDRWHCILYLMVGVRNKIYVCSCSLVSLAFSSIPNVACCMH